ncbi:type II toxin-antitoxin system PemK/MazF family toxin [Ureibacillus acetophenoni]|uniref:mRNA-degrading endonuclease toxin of MazEF toxin-antitoxin module n=1 Tax=Ureibacillus acetophenoni TaxID=614649 RepID=A0A285UIU6_9BACL|nr:type II toxin-antitoxin system PemK/MazF family toxin [Ureibacillus acetophenoni]SOC41769.1 mRNA-degrading endonuclease toxin of MazEF toxin-antitoxin module [Ureibacillus acetophenoni]
MSKREYEKEAIIDEKDQDKLINELNSIFPEIKKPFFKKTIDLIKNIPLLIKLHYNSKENKRLQSLDKNKLKQHPIRPTRGQIFNAEIGENIGSELSGNHLVIIMQNDQGNKLAEKVNVLPIEGDGNKGKRPIYEKLTNDDLEWGKIDKDPSRIVITNIMTLDKARLGIRIGKVKKTKMNEISRLLKGQLGL